MKKIILCPNPYRDKGFLATRRVIALLEGSDLVPVVCLPFKSDIPCDLPLASLQQEVRTADMIVAFGGDGTIMHLAKMASLRNLPMLGVNLGSLGFISELEFDELPRMRELADWKFATESRMMLDVSVQRAGKQIYSNLALNEAVVTKGAVSHVINLHITSDALPLVDVRGDGVIVATPTGSTGYSLSAGGPVVEPTARNLILSPICAHTIRFNSYVLSPEHTLCVQPLDAGKRPVFLSVDGGRAFPLRDGDGVRVRKSRHETKLVRLSDKSFCEIFQRKIIAGGQEK